MYENEKIKFKKIKNLKIINLLNIIWFQNYFKSDILLMPYSKNISINARYNSRYCSPLKMFIGWWQNNSINNDPVFVKLKIKNLLSSQNIFL